MSLNPVSHIWPEWSRTEMERMYLSGREGKESKDASVSKSRRVSVSRFRRATIATHRQLSHHYRREITMLTSNSAHPNSSGTSHTSTALRPRRPSCCNPPSNKRDSSCSHS